MIEHRLKTVARSALACAILGTAGAQATAAELDGVLAAANDIHSQARSAQARVDELTGIFSFVETEGMVGSVERTRQLYGRVLPIHLERAGMRGDSLKD